MLTWRQSGYHQDTGCNFTTRGLRCVQTREYFKLLIFSHSFNINRSLHVDWKTWDSMIDRRLNCWMCWNVINIFLCIFHNDEIPTNYIDYSWVERSNYWNPGLRLFGSGLKSTTRTQLWCLYHMWLTLFLLTSRGVGISFLFLTFFMVFTMLLFIVGGPLDRLVCDPIISRELFTKVRI